MRCGLDLLTPKQSRHPVEETTVLGDEPITEFADERDGRNVFVEPQWPRLSGQVSHQPENGFRAACAFPIRIDEPDRAFEFVGRDFGIAPTGFLRRRIGDALARELPPIIDPDDAEATSTVVNEDRVHTSARSICNKGMNFVFFDKVFGRELRE